MPDFSLIGGLLYALASLGVAAAPAPADNQPIYLKFEPAGQGISLQVVGKSEKALSASYALEVTSQSQGGTNRSTQRGNVRLEPGVPVTLVRLNLGSVQGGNWSAKLSVNPEEGGSYEVVRSSESQ